MNGRMYRVYSRRVGTQFTSRLDEGGHGTDEIVDRQFRQVQTLGRVLETLGVRIRTEQPSGAIGMTVGFRPSKHS